MKEITPYLYSILFKKRIQTYSNYNETFTKWTVGNKEEENPTPNPPINKVEQYVEEIQVAEPIKYVIEEEEEDNEQPLQEIPVKNLNTNTPPTPTPIPNTNPNKSRFIPKKPDSLFWSIFVGQYGTKEFFAIGSKYTNRELEEKSNIVEYLKSMPGAKTILKSMNLTTTELKEMMGDLMIQKKTNFMVIHAFVLYYKRSIWIINEETRSYFPINYPREDIRDADDDDHLPIFIYRNVGGKGDQYLVEIEPQKNHVETICQEYVAIYKHNKPMKGMSAYTSKELNTMLEKMKRSNHDSVMKIDPKSKKQDLYISLYRILEQTCQVK
jgi:hypothetical protein